MAVILKGFPFTMNTSYQSMRYSANAKSQQTAISSDNAFVYVTDSNHLIVQTYKASTSAYVYLQLETSQNSQISAVFDKYDNLYYFWNSGTTVTIKKWNKPTNGWATALKNNEAILQSLSYDLPAASWSQHPNTSGAYYPIRLVYSDTGTNGYVTAISGTDSPNSATVLDPWVAISFDCSDLSKKGEVHFNQSGAPTATSVDANALSYIETVQSAVPFWGSTTFFMYLQRTSGGSYAEWVHGITISSTGVLSGFRTGNSTSANDTTNQGYSHNGAFIPVNKTGKFMYVWDGSQDGHGTFKVVQFPMAGGLSTIPVGYSYNTNYFASRTAINTYKGNFSWAPFTQWISFLNRVRVWMPANDGNIYVGEFTYNPDTNAISAITGTSTAVVSGITTYSNSSVGVYWKGIDTPRSPSESMIHFYNANAQGGLLEDMVLDGVYPNQNVSSPVDSTVNMAPNVLIPLDISVSSTFNNFWGTNHYTNTTWTTYKLKRTYGATTEYYNASTDTWGATETANSWTSSVSLKQSQFTNGTTYSVFLILANAVDETSYGTAKVFTPVAATGAPASPTPRRLIRATLPVANYAHLFTVDNRTLINKITIANAGTSASTVSLKANGIHLLAPVSVAAGQTLTYETSQLLSANDVITVSNTGTGVDAYITGTEGI